MKDKISLADLILKIILIAGVCLFALSVIYINLFHYMEHIDADIAGESLVARASWVHQSLRPKEWYLGPESRIFYLTTFVSVIYGITGSLKLSMGIGCILAMLVMLIAVYYTMHAAGMRGTGIWLSLLAFMAIPINVKYLELTYLYAGYYSVNIIMMLFALGFYIKLVRKEAGFIKSGFVIHGICAFLLGCSGMRGILNIYAPLFAVEALRLLIEWIKERKNKKISLLAPVFVVSTLLVSFIGTCLPLGKNIPISKSIRGIPHKFIYEVLPSLADIFGFSNFSPSKIALYLLLTIVILLAVTLAAYVVLHLDISNGKHLLLAFLWAAPLIAIVMETAATVEASFRYTFILVIMAGLSMAVLFEGFRIRNHLAASYVIAGLVILFSILNLNITYRPMMPKEVNSQERQRIEITDWMQKENIFYGYASFNNAGPFTVQADGRVQVSPVDDFGELTPLKWLSDMTWYPPYVPVEEETAYILKRIQANELESALSRHPDIEKAFETEDFIVYVSPHNYVNEPT